MITTVEYRNQRIGLRKRRLYMNDTLIAASLPQKRRILLLLYKLTVNQNIPADGVAPVSISARLENGCAAEGIINQIKELDGVVEVKLVNSR